jgi:molybdopterin-guanine dinucleotide biosynthesis protein A
MYCIITAGGRAEPDDPLYIYTQDKPKALLDMGGRTMLERVVDALQSSQYVEDIVVVGLGDDMGMTFQRPVYHLSDQGGMVSNVLAGIRWIEENRPGVETLLACSADIPLITSAIIDDFVERSRPWDKGVYYNFVTREVMEARFPGSRRTFVKLKGLEVAGGDVIIGQVSLAESNRELWEALTNARKHAWRIARVVGLRMLLKFLFRQVSLRDIEDTIGRLVGCPASAILNPHAEIAMDVDKPYQVELARAELSKKID